MREALRDAATLIVDGISSLSYEDFIKDRLRYFGLVKNVEMIGEASYMLTPDFKKAHPDIPWDSMIKMRHVLVHGYASILPEILWETCTKDMPSIIPEIARLLGEVQS